MLMTPEQLTAAGVALYGDQWQSNLARRLNIDSRRIRQWLSGERPLPEWLPSELSALLTQNIEECTRVLNDLR